MIPLTLVAGFLGAGKTTLLRRFLVRLGGRKALFLVNEFADEEVDATLLAEAGGLVRAVSGGSVFCACKADEFKDRLVEAAETPGLEGVVVEASGMAEPRAMGKILADPRLAERYGLSALVAVADPVTFSKLEHTLPAIVGQVAEADIILLNKCDLATSEQVERAEARLRAHNPKARIVRTVNAEAELDPFPGGYNPERRLAAALTGCGDRAFASLLVGFDRSMALDAFEALLGDLDGAAVRVKGWLNVNGGKRLFVERATLGTLTAEPAGDGPSRLVLIVPTDAVRDARRRIASEPGGRLLD